MAAKPQRMPESPPVDGNKPVARSAIEWCIPPGGKQRNREGSNRATGPRLVAATVALALSATERRPLYRCRRMKGGDVLEALGMLAAKGGRNTDTILWIIAAVLVIAGIVSLLRGAFLVGIALIVVGLLVGPGGVSILS